VIGIAGLDRYSFVAVTTALEDPDGRKVILTEAD